MSQLEKIAIATELTERAKYIHKIALMLASLRR